MLLRLNSGKILGFLNRRVLLSACIHTSSAVPAKSFVDGENNFAHNVLVRLGNYNLMPVPRDLQGVLESDCISTAAAKDNSQLVDRLEKIAHYCKQHSLTISDERWDGIVDTFVSQISSFADSELLQTLRILTIFPPAPGVGSRNFLEMWTALDDECLKRLDNWSTQERLLACDHWFRLNMAKVSNFPMQATKRMGRNLKRLTPSQLVQTLFYVNMQRKIVLEMFPFETALGKVIDQLSIDEIAIMSMGFFKTQTKLNIPEVVEEIYKRLTDECLTLSDISLTAILKLLRYSAKLPHAEKVKAIQRKLTPRIPELSLLSCLHLALLGTNFQCCDPECIAEVIRRFKRDYKNGRLKDYERIAFVMGLFNVSTEDSKSLCESILAEIPNRKQEIMKYKRCYPSLLNYLATCGHYDKEMISVALTKQFYEAAYGQNLLLGRDIFCLDSFTRIQLKGQYEGEQLSERGRRNYAKLLCHYIPQQDSKHKMSVSDKCLLETKATLDRVYSGQCTVLENILPHFDRADILMAFDSETKKPLEVKSLHLPENYSGIILTREELLKSIDNSENIRLVTIVFGGFNAYIRGTEERTGTLRMKLEQLEMIGHGVVEVPFFEWQRKTPREQEVYLTHKIGRALTTTIKGGDARRAAP